MWRSRRNTTDRDALSLVVHGPEFRGGELLVLNPETFPDVRLHDLLEVAQPERAHPRLVLSVESLAPVRGKLQVSVAKDIAAQFGLEAFRPVTVRRVDQRDVSVDFVELSFKDQFLSRADVWRFKVTMLGQCVYVGRTVECLGIRSQVDAILASGTPLDCGVIGDATKIVARSRSSRLFWLVQMSTEMWEFAPDGEIYYEKLLNRLLRVLIAKWSESSVSHSVTIIAFSRSFYDANQFPDGFDPRKAPFSDPRRQGFGPGCGAPGSNMANGYGPTIHVDPVSGRYYEDFYKVVVMNFTGPDWSRLLLLLKKEFASYYETHRWRTPEELSPAQYEICRCPKPTSSTTDPEETSTMPVAEQGKPLSPTAEDDGGCEDLYVKWAKLPSGVPSRAKDGNILEAINVTLNVLDKHYMDRDLSRTGQGIVMMTAGCSIFNVNSKLAEITEQRMMDNGVGMDMISLSTPPLHVVPLFIYCIPPSAKPEASNAETPSFMRKFSFSEVSGASEESKSIEAASSFHGISSLMSTSQPKSPEWVRAGSDVLRPSCTSATLSDNAATADPPDSREKVTYDVPHWVNITFLDFGCGCGRANGSFSHAELPAALFPNQHKPTAQQTPRGWHSCACQVKRNQQFNPLPSFRMFDVTSPSEKLVFPVTLRNMMRRDSKNASSFGLSAIPACVPNDEEISKNDSKSGEVSATAGTPLSVRIAGNQNRLLFETSALPDSVSSAPPPEQLQLSRSPDFEPILASGQLRSATNLSASLHARAALKEYDESVFAPVVRGGESTARNLRDRRFGFARLESHDEHCSVTSATIGGYGDGHLEWFRRNARKEAERTRQRSNSGNSGNYRTDSSFLPSESSSIVQTLISPRKVKPSSPSLTKILQPQAPVDHNQQQPTSSLGIQIASRSVPKVEAIPSFSLEVMLGSSMERRGSYRNMSFATRSTSSSNRTPYGTPGKNRDEGFRPLTRAATMIKELPSTSGRSSAHSPPPGTDGFPGKLASNQRRLSNPGSPLGGLRRNQSELFRTSLMPGSLSFKASSATDLAVIPIDRRKVAVNPFRYAKAQGSWRLLIDRRRWSHLFPVSNQVAHRSSNDVLGETPTQDGEPMFLGPNWTSLTSPATLPLTTDHFPSPQELRQRYTEAFYTLTIPTTATQVPTIECVPRYRSHDELLIEMICQRLARDFQLVSSCDSTASLMDSESIPENRRRVYHLSMGHRIHQLIYDAERQTVEVKRFVQREPHDPEVAYTSYNYSLWVGLTQSFQPHQQIFYRYPQPEDNWNALDNLLCGYLDDMADTMKCRRIRFAIVPPVITNDGIEVDTDSPTTYAAKFAKFIEYLQSRVAPSEFGELENITINMVLEHPEAAREPGKAPPLGGNRMLSFKMACKASTLSVSASSVSKFEDSRTEWVMMRLEETMDISRCFHLDVRWLACSGIAADEFVGTVRRRAKQAGLDLRRVPEYSSVSRVQLHPLIASVFLPLPVRISESFVAALTEALDFVLDDERIADGSGIGYGLGIDQETLTNKPRATVRGHRRSPSTNARLLLERWQQRGYKQLIHRRVPVFVRIIHDGFIWIPGYDYDRKGDGATGVAATEALFQEVCSTIESQCSESPGGGNVSL
ncbi:GATOR complex protein depdc5 [Phytophthora pseudosyringae]|uniref:GATOR complex protein depdc5 n=1 Tax=Phytophthora pseudosyringae TaxID=221518 RepID=A0A8T1VJZ9_9STRA|nr:GATOR complex protein depdc5 [Phytophthora pseudosyringae]